MSEKALNNHEQKILSYLIQFDKPTEILKNTFPESALFEWTSNYSSPNEIYNILLSLQSFDYIRSSENNKKWQITDKGILTIRPIIEKEILADKKANAEIQLLSSQNIDYVQRIVDYTKIKAREKRLELHAALGWIIALLAILYQWLHQPKGG